MRSDFSASYIELIQSLEISGFQHRLPNLSARGMSLKFRKSRHAYLAESQKFLAKMTNTG
jgi:hypothetical protein